MTDFFRLSGGGNDFLALVEPPRDPSAGQIRAWCARGLSLGADGLYHYAALPGRAQHSIDEFKFEGDRILGYHQQIEGSGERKFLDRDRIMHVQQGGV